MKRRSRSNRKPRKRHTNRHCPSGNVRYRDKTEANGALRSIKNASDRDKVPGEAYSCQSCNGWHITNRSPAT